MASLMIGLKTASKNRVKKILIELDANKFERLAATFGFFSREFLQSLEQAEKDFTKGKIRKIKSLANLR